MNKLNKSLLNRPDRLFGAFLFIIIVGIIAYPGKNRRDSKKADAFALDSVSSVHQKNINSLIMEKSKFEQQVSDSITDWKNNIR